MEIRCDLDVTGNMENRDKARYLSTIVTMLKNAGAKRAENEFCGVTALVTGNHEPEIIERFRIVAVTETETDNSYSVKCIDNTYYVYFHK